MDIKPIKKRRHRLPAQAPPPVKSSQTNNRRKITLRPKTNPSQLSGNTSAYGSNNKILALLRKNLFLMIFLVLMAILYLPTSNLINTSGQYKDLSAQSSSVDSILNEVSFLPQKFLLLGSDSSGLNGRFIAEALSFIFIILTVYVFYSVCLRWLGKNVALITTLLFSTSSWVILSSHRLDFNDIYLIFVPLTIYINYLLVNRKNGLKVFAAAVLFSLALYSPGMVWPVLGLIILLPVFMQAILAKYNLNNLWILLLATAILILPLFASFIVNTANFPGILTGEGQISIDVLWQNIQAAAESLFINGLPAGSLWLFGTPILNYLIVLLGIFGLIFLATEKRLRGQFDFLLVCLIFSVLSVAFVGLPALSLLIPTVYLIAGFGIKFLLNHWYAIFPSNPVARNLGLSLIILVVLLSSAYEITRYYIAWPKAHDLISVSDPAKAA